ncbi:MAG: hypothetical protein CML40_02265 [Rhodobacteraceae bacterium]|nr:MAG: hypothetical protein CML40_02265 [Paracoccaceae bacterium]
MKKYLLGILLFFSACNTITTLPHQISVLDENETLGARDDSSFPIQAAKYVSLHADRSLRLNSTCTQVLRLNLVQKKGYKDTITELKNRAVLMGGNSVSLLSWREQDSRTILLGNIYMCKGKSFHLHPHPQV